MPIVPQPEREKQITKTFRFVAADKAAGQRLDQFLSQQNMLRDVTRSRIQNLIRTGSVLVNGLQCKSGFRVREKDTVTVAIPPLEPSALIPEKVFFKCIYEDEELIVVSKPPGVVVHPSCGHRSGTLVHGLLHHCANLAENNDEQRPGIVHRLDKDTSGIMVIAKKDHIHAALMKQFKLREVKKTYLALLDGRLNSLQGRIDKPIGRHPVHRKKMAVRNDGGRNAATSWKVLEEFSSFSYVQLQIETGRTHQIRVHMAYLGHPVAGDTVYGRNKIEYSRLGITRQCLHAYKLSFQHPRTNELLHLTAPLWDDMANSLDTLRNE